MTYRNKLRLRRFLKILGIVLLVLFVLGLIGFSYLGRYVVYTEDGAHFSFHSQSPDSTASAPPAAPIEAPVLVTGASIHEESIDEGSSMESISSTEVSGLFIDYNTLSDPAAANTVDLSTGDYNTIVMEMRIGGSDILNSTAVQELIARAKGADIRPIAMISCLDDSSYALEHPKEALQISGGALWMSDSGSYWLDPTQSGVQEYLASMIAELTGMGFEEVILNNFTFPQSASIVYNSDTSREELLQSAYKALEKAVSCPMGILVKDPETGHQAFDLAEHLYIYYNDGSTLKQYVASHSDYYMIFFTSSHDTRFDAYGKIYTSKDVDYFSSRSSSTGDSADGTGDETAVENTEAPAENTADG